MPRYNRTEDFELGLSQLIPFFDAQGFSLIRGEPDVDKEGTSYSARFIRHLRSVELNHLYSLSPVIYSIRQFSVEHTYYMRALGVTGAAQFPCFSDDSISGYPALLHDLENLLSPFFVGSEEDFSAIAKQYLLAQQRRNEADSRDLSYHATGEDRLKARARELFRQGRYDEVDQIESQLRFPELLTDSERKIFALARNRR
jgi:hypothetical protein